MAADRNRRTRDRPEGHGLSACALKVELLIMDVPAKGVGHLRCVDAAPRRGGAVNVIPTLGRRRRCVHEAEVLFAYAKRQ